MAKSKLKYFNRAFFKPDSLDVFDGFDTGLGLDGRGLGYSQVWHRGATDYSPFAVYNEYICGEIGRFLRLPIPPFAITHHEVDGEREWLFSSLDFNFNRAKLPPVIPETCVKRMPALCAGVVAFDILIANEDRHDRNLLVDNVLTPKEMHIFDHDQALLGGVKESGADKLKAFHNRLGITGGTATGGNRHVLIDHIDTCANLYEWANRIRDIPEWFVNRICEEAIEYGLDPELATKVASFLADRGRRIKALIDDNRNSFNINDWPAQAELFP